MNAILPFRKHPGNLKLDGGVVKPGLLFEIPKVLIDSWFGMSHVWIIPNRPGPCVPSIGLVLSPPCIFKYDKIVVLRFLGAPADISRFLTEWRRAIRDRKSTRLNSSHLGISYAVF